MGNAERKKRAVKKAASLMVSGVPFNPSKISTESREAAGNMDTANQTTYVPELVGNKPSDMAQVSNPTKRYVDNSVVTEPFKPLKARKKSG